MQAQNQTKSVDIGVGGSLLVAALAGCGNVLLTTPIWTVATRMQVNSSLFLHGNESKRQAGIPVFWHAHMSHARLSWLFCSVQWHFSYASYQTSDKHQDGEVKLATF